MTRWTIGLRVAFAAGILLCPSPACWPQQVARQSGLLLGLADPSDEKLKYQTLWLHPSASHVNTRLLQGLVVPRQDGFWRVDSADTCSLDIEGDDGIERSVDGENNDDRRISVSIEQQEQLWFAPVGSVPHIQGISCDAINDKAARISRAAEAKIKAAGKKVAEGSHEGDVCVSSSSAVEFINGRYMSVAYGSSTDCGVHPDGSSNWLVQPFGGSTGIKIEEVFGPSATVRFQKAAQDHIQDANDENCKPETIDTSDWSLSHAQGRWRVKGYATTHRLCGYYEDFDLNLNPPERITGPQFGSDKMDWGRLSRSMPDVNVLDAVIAPDQSWGALLVGPPCKTPQKNCDLSRSLQIYQFENGRPAKKISTTKVTIGAEIVMAEWALGKNADRWDETMGKLPVSPPTVQFDPPDSHK